MSKDIRIKKGLNINLIGEAEKTTSKAVLVMFMQLIFRIFTELPLN